MYGPLLGALFFALQLQAAPQLTTEQRLQDFDQVVYELENTYAFLDYKQEIGLLKFDVLVGEYRDQVLLARNFDSFKFAMVRFIAEFHDLHMNLIDYNGKNVSLGFTTDWVDSKVVVNTIDHDRHPNFPFAKGDELIAIDGIPVSELKNTLSQYVGMSHRTTRNRWASYLLTDRSGARMPVPTGGADVTVLTRDGLTKTIKIDWKEREEVEKRAQLAGLGDMCSNQTRFKAPENAVFIEDIKIDAYSYEAADGRRIGVLRIPHFSSLTGGYDDLEGTFNQYLKAIKSFEQTTDGLIIDQTYNCGGSVSMVLKMVSLFTSHEFHPTEFDFRVSDQQIVDLDEWHVNFQPSSIASTRFLDILNIVRDAQQADQKFTKKVPFWGFMNYQLPLEGEKTVQPHPDNYTKPVVVLINEMSGSGGDMFPALMQDWRLAKVVGQKTMGAGGHVWNATQLKHSKLHFSMTKSRIYRTDGSLLENNGVTPDIHYEPRMNDFLNDYSPYREYVETLL